MSQRVLYADGSFGVWLYGDRVHGQLYRPDGSRLTLRMESAAPTPLAGAQAVAGQETEVIFSWTPEGTGIFVNGELRMHLDGEFARPGPLVYGAHPVTNGAPFTGALQAAMFETAVEYDPCASAVEGWGTVQLHGPTGTVVHHARRAEQPAECVVEDPGTTLNWLPPTECENGMVIPSQKTAEDGSTVRCADLTAYRVYTGTDMLIEIPAPADTITVYNQPSPTCYEMTAVAGEQESVRSNQACK